MKSITERPRGMKTVFNRIVAEIIYSGRVKTSSGKHEKNPRAKASERVRTLAAWDESELATRREIKSFVFLPLRK